MDNAYSNLELIVFVDPLQLKLLCDVAHHNRWLVDDVWANCLQLHLLGKLAVGAVKIYIDGVFRANNDSYRANAGSGANTHNK